MKFPFLNSHRTFTKKAKGSIFFEQNLHVSKFSFKGITTTSAHKAYASGLQIAARQKNNHLFFYETTECIVKKQFY